MVRSLILDLHAEWRSFSPPAAHGQRGPPNRDNIWRDWATTIFNDDKEGYGPWGGRDGIAFPALEKLTLNFEEWQLTENEGLLVRSFESVSRSY